MDNPNKQQKVTSPLPITGKGCPKGGKGVVEREGAALFISRSPRFSPNSVENDRLILEGVAREMEAMGNEVRMMSEEEVLTLKTLPKADVIFCMARSNEALEIIERSKARIVNAPEGIRICGNRQALTDIMRRLEIPLPPENGDNGIWLKRGIGTAEVAEDTVFCNSEEEVADAMRKFADRGITEVCRQAHVVGDLVKFYGVANTDFFYHFYPTDSGRSKFGSEEHNGKAHHYPFSAEEMKKTVDRLAITIGVIVYGGDAIVKADGSFVIIDFNDWPTFSPCREEAAKKIATAPHSSCGHPLPIMGKGGVSKVSVSCVVGNYSLELIKLRKS